LAVFVGLLIGLASATVAEAQFYREAREPQQIHSQVTRLANELREARHVERETRRYSHLYGLNVGRWVWLARQTGWGWDEIPTLMFVIDRETGGTGDPKAKNPDSTASGLLQFLAFHFDGSGDHGWRFDPFNPRAALTYGHKLYRLAG
jgi:hypothetical protein